MSAYDEGWEDAYDNLCAFSEDSYSKDYFEYMLGYNDALESINNDFIPHEWDYLDEDFGLDYNEDDIYVDYY